MADHASPSIDRYCDVAIIGGTPAGLAGALHLARRHRSVIVVDGGNQPHRHGEGTPASPDDAAAAAREDVRAHGGEVIAGRVVAATRTAGGWRRLELDGGHAVVSRRLLADQDVAEPLSADEGSRAGATIGDELDTEDAGGSGPLPGNRADWEHRYSGDQLWSGNPNGSLVDEVRGMTPGRALDVGAGEGGDALWLAAQGWQVTATDISERALARLQAEAARRALTVDVQRRDANTPDAFERAAYDLVSAQYASIPRTPDDRAIRNLLSAVSPGGTLLVVGHDLGAMRQALESGTHAQAFDPDAYVRIDDIAAHLEATPEWTVQVHGARPRPPGATTSHHVNDVVLRARRSDG